METTPWRMIWRRSCAPWLSPFEHGGAVHGRALHLIRSRQAWTRSRGMTVALARRPGPRSAGASLIQRALVDDGVRADVQQQIDVACRTGGLDSGAQRVHVHHETANERPAAGWSRCGDLECERPGRDLRRHLDYVSSASHRLLIRSSASRPAARTRETSLRAASTATSAGGVLSQGKISSSNR